MAIVPRLFPTVEKEKKPSYIRYIQKRNYIITLASISIFIGICMILFTILCMVLLKKHMIHDRDGNPYKDAWFLWPIWIFYCIAMAIAISQIYARYKEFKELRAEIFPVITDVEQQQSAQQQQQQQEQQQPQATQHHHQQQPGQEYDNGGTSMKQHDGELESGSNDYNTGLNYRDEDLDDDVAPTKRQERKQQRTRLTTGNTDSSIGV